MPRFIDETSLNESSFIEQWTRLAGISSLLLCAGRTGRRIGIWGGCVRNFVLDDRALSNGEQSIHFIDFIDPFSDIDCVIDQVEDWPLIAQAISESVAFAGYHRWEYRTISQVVSSVEDYAHIASESFIVWHEGFDNKRQPKISIQILKGEFDSILRDPLSRTEGHPVQRNNPWQEVFDALRLSRYVLQYPSERYSEEQLALPDRQRAERIAETKESKAVRNRNLLRFDLAVLDILMTAKSLPLAIGYVRNLRLHLPTVITDREDTVIQIVERFEPTLSFLGALVFRQRNDSGLRLKLMTRVEQGLSHGGLQSIIPWTYLWSLGSGDDDCCRHKDFKNGVAVLSWRPNNTSVTYSQSQALEFAPATQIARYAPYGDTPEDEVPSMRRLFSIPGIVRVGPSLTLRFDHGYMAQLLGRNVALYVGVVGPETSK
jgi:hypothetical protein